MEKVERRSVNLQIDLRRRRCSSRQLRNRNVHRFGELSEGRTGRVASSREGQGEVPSEGGLAGELVAGDGDDGQEGGRRGGEREEGSEAGEGGD